MPVSGTEFQKDASFSGLARGIPTWNFMTKPHELIFDQTEPPPNSNPAEAVIAVASVRDRRQSFSNNAKVLHILRLVVTTVG